MGVVWTAFDNIYTGYEWTRAAFESAALKAGRRRAKLTTLESMMAGAIAGRRTSAQLRRTRR
jgi:hypothetical protein